MLVFAPFIVPVTIAFALTERAETTGYTELSGFIGFIGSDGHNYGVFRKGRFIYMATRLAPARIMERDGKIVRTNTIMLKTLPVMTTSPATAAEETLWRRHFSS